MGGEEEGSVHAQGEEASVPKPEEPSLSLGSHQPIPITPGETAPQDQNVLTLVQSATNACIGLEAAFSNALPLNPSVLGRHPNHIACGGEGVENKE